MPQSKQKINKIKRHQACAGKHRWKLLIMGIAVLFIIRNIWRLSQNTGVCLPSDSTLLVIAHPDDESMFFSPFLFNFPCKILCLSNGGFAGLGEIRRGEMEKLCRSRGWVVKMLEYPDGADWDAAQIAKDVLRWSITWKIENIVTFDKFGVSGHKNHKSCHKAVYGIFRKLQATGKRTGIYFLRTETVFRKFIIFFNNSRDVLLTVPVIFNKTRVTYFYGLSNMLYHRSQLSWYRCLYIMFSSYMHANRLLPAQ